MSTDSFEHLLHPELITRIPLTGDKSAEKLNRLVGKTASQPSIGLPAVSLVIRAVNEASALEGLLNDVEQQRLGNDIQVIVVDNESDDNTQAVARSYGSDVVQIDRSDFTYPRSLNVGMEAADNPVVFLTVGHARLSNRQTFVAASHHLADSSVGAVFARVLPGANASDIERTIAMGNLFFMKPAYKVKKAGFGVMAAQNLAVSKAAWEELGRFDEHYEAGGEDTAMGAKMLKNGLSIVEDQVVAVHHTHGLGPINTIKQWRHWMRTVKGPFELDMEELKARRPDLNI